MSPRTARKSVTCFAASAKADAYSTTRHIWDHTHRPQYMRGFGFGTGTGGTAGYSESGTVKLADQRFAVNAGQGEESCIGQTLRAFIFTFAFIFSTTENRRALLHQPRFEHVAQRSKSRHLNQPLGQQAVRPAEADDRCEVFGTRAQTRSARLLRQGRNILNGAGFIIGQHQ